MLASETRIKPVSTNFDGSLTVIGPPDGTVLKVLQKVTYPDGSSTQFDHNGYGQVYKITNAAADLHVLNYVRTNLETPALNQFDCPRFTETRSSAENFNGGVETVVNNTLTPNQTYSLPGGISGTAARIDVWMAGHPNGAVSKTYVAESGWREAMPLATEDWTYETSGWDRKRWTSTTYTQDNPNLAYIQNPRATESRVGDAANVKKTSIEYCLTTPCPQAAPYGLATAVNVYGADLSTVLKRVETDYNLSATYTDKRIIGLSSETRAWGRNDETNALEFVSKVVYAYDGGNFGDTSLNQNIAPVQHESAVYGQTFIAGRANLTSTTRCDVTVSSDTLGNCAGGVTSTVKYNTAGAAVSQTDPLARTVKIGYTDSFNSTSNPATFAYPTTITGPAGTSLGDPLHSSTVKYRHDTGANVRAESPAPQGQAQGKITEREFDSIGRLLKDKVVNLGGAYTRYEYPANGIQSKVYSTITDTNANLVGDAADEVMSESWTDGAGRVRRSRTEHPGSIGGWSGSIVEYDILGRVKRQSVPTEVSVPNAGNPDTWAPAGDDLTRGWLWTYQKYDWMGRVIRKINTDGTDQETLNDSDQLFTYEGCGCAGGQVTTIEGERVPVPDTSNFARRKQKVHEDILGRAFKSITYQWDGASAYSTTEHKFNGRDQIVQSRQTDNTSLASPQAYQDTTAAFDGHGRLKTRHIPQQDANAVTTYNYNPDDSIESVVDARGAITAYTYNNRALLTNIDYSVPQNSGIGDPTSIVFGYDNLGNRTSMVDGLGTIEYSYDSLSQMTSELREFDDELISAPEIDNGFKIEYSYHIGGQLKSLTEPFGVEAKYNLDKIGRLTSVTPATTYGTTTAFASGAQYRAFGALKQLNYGNGMQMNQTFNNKLQAASYQLGDSQSTVMQKSYDYYSDGKLKHMDDALNWKFDRLNTYDHMGRIKEAKSSSEANGTEITNVGQQLTDLPYRQSYKFNAFGDMTERYNKQWGGDINLTKTYDMTNQRITAPPGQNQWQYDADGRVAETGYPETRSANKYNAAGQLVEKHDYLFNSAEDKLIRLYDGDGRETKRLDDECRFEEPLPGEPPPTECTWMGETTQYYIRSTVLGGETIAETYAGGLKGIRYVRAGGTILAHLRENYVYQQGGGYTYDAAYYEHTDASGMSFRTTKRLAGTNWWDYSDERQAEFDPFNGNVGLTTSYSPQPGPPNEPPIPLESESVLYIDGQVAEATVDGAQMSWQMIRNMAESGSLQVNLYHNGRVVTQRDVSATVGGLQWDSSSTTRRTGWRQDGDRLYPILSTSVNTTFVSNPFGPPPRQPIILGFNIENTNLLSKTLQAFRDKDDCTAAFKAAGVATVAEQIDNGLTILEKLFVQNAANDKDWVPEGGLAVADGMREAYADNENWMGISKTNDVASVGPRPGGGRYFSLSSRGLGGVDEHFPVVLVHSLIHTGGKGGRRSHFTGRNYNNRQHPIMNPKTGNSISGTGGPIYESSVHDLEWMGAHYNKIIDACTGLVPKAGQARGR